MQGYLNVNEVETTLSNLAAKFPLNCQLIDLPHATFEGRTCRAVRLKGGATSDRPAIFLTGGLHAREWGSCEILINLAVDLLEAFTSNRGLRYGNKTFSAGDIQNILNRLNIVIFPLVNPDGRNYSQIHFADREAMWRKNRNPANSGGRPECVGVDINRNLDFLFDFEQAFSPLSQIKTRVSANPCDYQVYHGPAPFSEPETQNVKFLFDSNSTVRWFIDIHSFAEDLLFVWSDDDNQTTDPTMNFRNPAFNGKRGVEDDAAYGEFIEPADLEALKSKVQTFLGGLSAVRGKFYKGIPSFDLYPTCGTTDDYAYSRHLVDPGQGKIFSFTVEWGKEFQPVWDEMRLIVTDVTAGLIAFSLDAALESPPPPGVRGTPALIQSTFGETGNYEFVTPLVRGGIGHVFRNNDGSFFWSDATRFAADVGLVDAVTMIQSNFGPGNLELVARVGDRLAHFFRDNAWHGPAFLQEGVTGNPVLIQSTFGETGNFELVTPLSAGGLAHFLRNNDATGAPWSGPTPFGTDLGPVDAVTMIQSNLGPGNLELVARVGSTLRQFTRDHTPPFAWHVTPAPGVGL
jgi:murein tripeptide amidase MpaA